MKTIYEEWEEFRGQVLAKDAGPLQVAEMRMAFVAGSFLALAKLGPDPEASASTLWKRLYGESVRAMNHEQTALEDRAALESKP